ncbi:MAG: PEP-CTERM sorting domain-containing protein [Gammaproteobacteria bacterium]|nr:PEP-CTERM sorting domain-containing protein [Gammaproteobacteria bacterium]
MDFRALIFACLALFVSTSSHAVFIDGELTSSDALGVDAQLGDFYYDLYYVAVDAPMTIEVFMEPIDPFAGYIAYWDGNFSPAPDWDAIPPLGSAGTGASELLYMAFDAMPGINYQIMATTYFYNPTDLGVYFMHIVDPGRTDMGFTVSTSPILNVPEPSSMLLLGFGLLGLGLVKRRQPLFTA